MIEGSYLGHLRYGDTKNLVCSTIKRFRKDKYFYLGNKVIIYNKESIIICNKK